MKKTFVILTVILAVGLASCSNPTTDYDFEDYSNSTKPMTTTTDREDKTESVDYAAQINKIMEEENNRFAPITNIPF